MVNVIEDDVKQGDDYIARDILELNEDEWIEQQRIAGVFRSFEDELLARVSFRHFPKIMRALDERPPSQPPQARAPRKPSLASRVKAAQKAGAKDVDIKPDGTVTAAYGTEPIPNEWDTDLGIDKPRGH